MNLEKMNNELTKVKRDFTSEFVWIKRYGKMNQNFAGNLFLLIYGTCAFSSFII